MKEIYHILSAAMGEEVRMQQIANNLANVSTTGFKQDKAVFEDFFKSAQAGESTASASTPSVAQVARGYIDFSAGPLINTGNTFDLSIQGNGFFEIEGRGGEETLFSRAGNFTLSAEGYLTTAGGLRVLDGSGRAIAFGSDATRIEISETGEISKGGETIATLRPVRIADMTQLEKRGDSLYADPSALEHSTDNTSRIKQGFLEGSNVNPIKEMIAMIETQRAYEIQQRAIKSIDELVDMRIGQSLRS